MNISGTIYELDRKCLEIYVSGCYAPHCIGCHNPELWGFRGGKNWINFIPKITEDLNSDMVNEVWILGGEPLDQNTDDLYDLLNLIKLWYNIKIYLFTRYEVMDRKIFNLVDYIKTGEYLQDRESYYDNYHDIELASDNQKIIEGGWNGKR